MTGLAIRFDGQPVCQTADDLAVFPLAAVGAVTAEIDVPPLDGDNGLTDSAMQAVAGNRGTWTSARIF